MSLRRYAIVLAAILAPLQSAFAFDHSKLNGLLGKYVSAGKVDYVGLKAEKPALDAYIVSVGAASGTLPMGFYLNAYNAFVLGDLLAQPALPAKVTDLPGFFDARKHKVAGKDWTLNELETHVRTTWKDPRVHFALNCGARSCPALQAAAFSEDPAALNQKLTAITSNFLNGPGVKVDATKNEVAVTKLMDWYAADFVAKSGSVGAFVQASVTDAQKLAAVNAALGAGGKIVFLNYDWTPNAK